MAIGSTTQSGEARAFAAETAQNRRFIDSQLNKTRRHVKLVDLCAGLMLLGAGMLAALLAAALVDAWIFDLGRAGRIGAFLFILGGAAWFFFAKVLPLLLKPINPDYAAQAIEQVSPGLQNGLINLLMLRREPRQVREVVFDALEAQTAANLVHAPVDTAVDRARLIYIGYALAGLMTVCALYKILSPIDPFASFARVLAPLADIDRPTSVRFEEIEPGDAQIGAGQSIAFSARVTGIDDDEPVALCVAQNPDDLAIAALALRRGDAAADERPPASGDRFPKRLAVLMPFREADFKRHGELPALPEGVSRLHYCLVAGDAQSPAFEIEVLPLSIAVERIEYEFPKYTGRRKLVVARKGEKPAAREPNADLIVAENPGDLRALEGTKVTLHAQADQPLGEAYVEFDPQRDGERLGTSKRAGMSIDGRNARGEFALRLKPDRSMAEHSSYQLRFKTKSGFLNSRPIESAIEVIPDLAPTVEILTPRAAAVETPANRRVAIEVRGLDPDYRLTELTLEFEVPERPLLEESLLGESPGVGQVSATFEFVPEKHGAAVGQTVRYRAVARDCREPETNVAVTPWQEIVVTDRLPEPEGGESGADRREGPEGERAPRDVAAGARQPDASQGAKAQPANGTKPPKSPDRANPEENADRSPGDPKAGSDGASKKPKTAGAEEGAKPEAEKPQGKKPAGEEPETEKKESQQLTPPENASSKEGESGEGDSGGGASSSQSEGDSASGGAAGGASSNDASSNDGGGEMGEDENQEGAEGGSASGAGGASGEAGASKGQSASQEGGGTAASQAGGKNGGEAGGEGSQGGGAQSNAESGTEGGAEGSSEGGGASSPAEHDGEAFERILKHRQASGQGGADGQSSASPSPTGAQTGESQASNGSQAPNGAQNRSDRGSSGEQRPSGNSPAKEGEGAEGEQSGEQQPDGDSNTTQAAGNREDGRQQTGGAQQDPGQPAGSGQTGGEQPSGEQSAGQQGGGEGQQRAQSGSPSGGGEDSDPSRSPGNEGPGQEGNQQDAGEQSAGKESAGGKQGEKGAKGANGARPDPAGQASQGAAGGPSRDAQQPMPQGDPSGAGQSGEGAGSGGNETGSEAGGGRPNPAQGGAPQAQGKNADRQKQSQASQKGGEKQESQSPSISEKQSDSQGDSDGDRSGGGGAGGGQKAPLPGQDTPGQSSAAEEGAGAAQEPGDGATGNKAPQRKASDQLANQKTGASSRTERGEGSTSRPSENGDRTGSGEATDSTGGGLSRPGGADRTGEGPADAGGEAPPADKANLEYARKATDLALEYLKDQKDKPDKSLLKDLGWSEAELQDFLKKWQSLKDGARADDSAKKEFEASLESLGLAPANDKKRAANVRKDELRKMREGAARTDPPPAHLEGFKAFSQSLNRDE